MAPARPLKRQKTNPTEEARPQSSPQDQAQQAAKVPLPPETPPATSSSTLTAKEERRSSWLSRTWPRKAPPLTQTNRESVSSASTSNTAQSTKETAAQEEHPPPSPPERRKTQRSPSLAMTLGKSTSNRSLPINATTTIVNATPQALATSGKRKSQSDLSSKAKNTVTEERQSGQDDQRPEKAGEAAPTPVLATEPAAQSTPELSKFPTSASVRQPAPESSTMWLSWLPGKKEGGGSKATATQEPPAQPQAPSISDDPATTSPAAKLEDPIKPPPVLSAETEGTSTPTSNKRSWYQMLGSNNSTREPLKQPPQPLPETPKPDVAETNGKPTPAKGPTKNLDIPIPSTPKSQDPSQASSLETSPPPQLPGDASKSSAWVFWSREKKRTGSIKSESEPHVGELAISDTPSQARPKRASISLQDEARPNLKPKPKPQDGKPKIAAPQKPAVSASPAPEEKSTPKSQKIAATKKDAARTTKAESSNAAAMAKEPRPASPAPTIDKTKEDTNLLLPLLKDSLTSEAQPSLLQQLARLLYYTKENTEPTHLSLVKDPPRIKHALAIGVHGYFPGAMVRSILGQPTGTSIKFAEKAAQNIRKYTKAQGYDCEVKTAALEGEGRIAERVELLWKLLLNWIDEIRRSDFVMIAAHSQGVPVALMLVAKLIHFGCLSPTAKVGVCAMAGVNMGPFQDYKSPWITGSAGELFEFTDPNSKVSTDYLAAITECLRFGVKVTFVGSIDDQLVSMESSIFAPLTHPHIYRAVSIDSRIHAPNFLSNLVGFVLKLRNVGVPDHGLIRELSSPLAGSLYTGEGHSRVYEDDGVYNLAIAFALETTSRPNQQITSSKRAPLSANPDAKSGASATTSSGSSTTTSANPYILPFAMRGILEEDIVKKELRDEARRLLEQFDHWEPRTKALKDVKFRLEGVRSQLL